MPTNPYICVYIYDYFKILSPFLYWVQSTYIELNLKMGRKGIFGKPFGDKHCYLDYSGDYMNLSKTHLTIYLKWMDSIVCELYLISLFPWAPEL